MQKKKPYKPFPFREGNKIIKRYKVNFADPIGNKAIITKVDFLNNKNKMVEGYTLYIKWIA